jgi:hypothetical protein
MNAFTNIDHSSNKIKSNITDIPSQDFDEGIAIKPSDWTDYYDKDEEPGSD